MLTARIQSDHTIKKFAELRTGVALVIPEVTYKNNKTK
jgi:hypothetical protein